MEIRHQFQGLVNFYFFIAHTDIESLHEENKDGKNSDPGTFTSSHESSYLGKFTNNFLVFGVDEEPTNV